MVSDVRILDQSEDGQFFFVFLTISR